MSLRTRKISSFIIFIFCLCSAIIFIIIASNTGVRSIDDMTEIEATIETITPKKTKNSISYDLKLNEFNNLFRIGADYENLFNYQSLIKEVKTNQKMSFTISLKDSESLNSSKRIDILGIRTLEKAYLDKQETLDKDRMTRKYLAPIGGTMLILLSIGVYIYRRFYYRFDI
jgi:hypothetical protein